MRLFLMLIVIASLLLSYYSVQKYFFPFKHPNKKQRFSVVKAKNGYLQEHIKTGSCYVRCFASFGRPQGMPLLVTLRKFLKKMSLPATAIVHTDVIKESGGAT